MKALFKPKNTLSKDTFSLGIDIGTSSLKCVKLKHSKDKVVVCDFLLDSAQPDMQTALKKIPDLSVLKKITVSVSGPSTIIRSVNFLKMSRDELKNALKFEAQKYIPFSIAEVVLDSWIIKPELPDNKMLVLLAAVKKDYLNSRLKLINDAGIKVTAVDLDSLALVNAFVYNYPQIDTPQHQAAALVNIGESVTNLNIIEGQIPQLSRDINIAGKNFAQKISEILNVDVATAGQLKVNPDKERLTKIVQIMETVLSTLAAELRTSFDYYENQGASSVKKIYLSGGISLFPGFKDMLAGLLDIEVECWDPFKNVSIASEVDAAKLKSISGQLAVAVGLALRV